MADLNEDIALEEAFNPIDANTPMSTSTKVKRGAKSASERAASPVGISSRLSAFYSNYISAPICWFFRHVIPACKHGTLPAEPSHLGTESERLYLITFLVSIFWVAITTFIMGAVSQRWVEMIKAMGFISFPPSLRLLHRTRPASVR